MQKNYTERQRRSNQQKTNYTDIMASNYEGDSQGLRIVLLGVSGAGKSSVGSTILGRDVFKETGTTESEIQRGTVEDRNIFIINTPGFFNTHLTDEELQEQMMKSLDLSDPGPHAFLIIINLKTFEEDERNIFEKIEEIFGVQALKFTMVLFTGRDQITKKEWQEIELSEKFQRLVSKFRLQYHVINEIKKDHIKKLLKKIDEFIKQNDEKHFDSVSQKRSTKKKKNKQENPGKKEEEQTMQGTFEMNRATEEGLTVIEPTSVNEEPGLQEMNSLDRYLNFSNEGKGEEKEVKGQEHSLEKSQKKQKTTEGKHPAQAGGSQYVVDRILCSIFVVLLLVFILQQNSITAERDQLKSCKNTIQEFNQTINSLQDKYSEFKTEKDQWYQFSKNQVLQDLRIMLIGKTGAGKSASGNTILKGKMFKEKHDFESVPYTNTCQKHQQNGITVIDTPGKFDTDISEDQLKEEMEKCVNMSVPGPHVFLLVIRLDVRFTDEEKNTVKLILKNFGEMADDYTMVLFTRGDQLNKPIDKFLTENIQMNELVRQCKSRYHVFNNKNQKAKQVDELFEKMVKMVMENGREHYTNMMYMEAQKRQREEEERPSLKEENTIGLWGVVGVVIVILIVIAIVMVCLSEGKTADWKAQVGEARRPIIIKDKGIFFKC